jgi:serine/threonine-protein kinase
MMVWLYGLFVEVAGIAVAPDGAIYVADEKANRVRVIRDGIITTFAGTGVSGYEGDGAMASRARLTLPSALAVDVAGNVYISDTGNCAIRKVTPDATIETVVGSGRRGFAGDGGPAVGAVLAHQQGIAVADDGTIYIGDRLNSRIRRVTPDGVIMTIAGTGEQALAGDGGPALDASFGYLGRVQLDTDGGLLVADQTNSSIRKIMPPL